MWRACNDCAHAGLAHDKRATQRKEHVCDTGASSSS